MRVKFKHKLHGYSVETRFADNYRNNPLWEEIDETEQEEDEIKQKNKKVRKSHG